MNTKTEKTNYTIEVIGGPTFIVKLDTSPSLVMKKPGFIKIDKIGCITVNHFYPMHVIRRICWSTRNEPR